MRASSKERDEEFQQALLISIQSIIERGYRFVEMGAKNGHARLDNQHRIPIAEETILGFDRLGVGFQNQLLASKGAH